MVVYTSFLKGWEHRETVDVVDLWCGLDLKIVSRELYREVVESYQEKSLVFVLSKSVLLKGLIENLETKFSRI